MWSGWYRCWQDLMSRCKKSPMQSDPENGGSTERPGMPAGPVSRHFVGIDAKEGVSKESCDGGGERRGRTVPPQQEDRQIVRGGQRREAEIEIGGGAVKIG